MDEANINQQTKGKIMDNDRVIITYLQRNEFDGELAKCKSSEDFDMVTVGIEDGQLHFYTKGEWLQIVKHVQESY